MQQHHTTATTAPNAAPFHPLLPFTAALTTEPGTTAPATAPPGISRGPGGPSRTDNPSQHEAPLPDTERRGSWLLHAAAAAAFIVLLLAGTGWHLSGGWWSVIATPSMGRAAPVGTLVLTRPTHVADLKVGDIITYHPQGLPTESYTHRVVAVHPTGTVGRSRNPGRSPSPGGSVQVRGDMNGTPDPWPVTDRDLVGKVVARWWGLGWLVRGAPFLILGGLVLTLGTQTYASARYRSAARVMGSSALVALTGLIIRPYVRFVQISLAPRPHGARANLIATGLLPIRVSNRAHHLDLIAGQAGQLPVTVNHHGGYLLNATAHLTLPWWVVLTTLCAAPLLWCLTVGLSPLPDHTHPGADTDTGPALDPVLERAAPAGALERAAPASEPLPATSGAG